MQLMIAAAPRYRQAACTAGLPVANAAYRIVGGQLCALPMPPLLRGGAMLLTGAEGAFAAGTAAAVMQECRRRGYGAVLVPFPAPQLAETLAQPLHAAGIGLWVHEGCAHAVPGARVLVSTALSGGSIETRLRDCCRAFGPERVVLDLQRLRMDFPLPCPSGEGVPLTGEQLARLQTGRQVFFSRELGARYFTYRQGGATRFVLLDDADTLRRKIALGNALGIPRGLLTLPECGDILGEVTKKA